MKIVTAQQIAKRMKGAKIIDQGQDNWAVAIKRNPKAPIVVIEDDRVVQYSGGWEDVYAKNVASVTKIIYLEKPAEEAKKKKKEKGVTIG